MKSSADVSGGSAFINLDTSATATSAKLFVWGGIFLRVGGMIGKLVQQMRCC